MRLFSAPPLLALLIVFWLSLIAVGMNSVLVFESTPGPPKQAPAQFPEESKFQLEANVPNLLMLVHPRCPCSRASLSELKLLLSKVEGRVSAHVLFVQPEGTERNWEQGEVWNKAKQISGINVYVDHDGEVARRFNSQTSGQVLLFDATGRLLFSGGITAGRGHVGENKGRSAIESLLLQGQSESESTMVYGCPLFDESRALSEGTPECKH